MYKNDVDQVLRRSLTVGDLKRELECIDDEVRLVFVCDYGDYHHTQQALPVTNVVECDTCTLKDSAYSQSGISFVDPEEHRFEESEETGKKVVVMMMM